MTDDEVSALMGQHPGKYLALLTDSQVNSLKADYRDATGIEPDETDLEMAISLGLM
jgi:hypothetical protein